MITPRQLERLNQAAAEFVASATMYINLTDPTNPHGDPEAVMAWHEPELKAIVGDTTFNDPAAAAMAKRVLLLACKTATKILTE